MEPRIPNQGSLKTMRALLCCLSFLPLATLAQEPSTARPPPTALHISQATANGADINVYLEARDESGALVTGIQADQLAATVGRYEASVESVQPFAETSDGVTYLFLVDISKSITPEQFSNIRGAITDWVLALGPQDRAGLISFGDEVTKRMDPTSDHAPFTDAIAQLGPTDGKTALHLALVEGMALAGRRGNDLPERRVIVTLTDGIDDRPGLSSAGEVRDQIADDPVPIYSIGYASVRDRSRRDAGLTALGEFSRRSGGVFVDASGTPDPAEAFAAMRERIRAVYKVDVHCADCVLDGNKHYLHIALRSDGFSLDDGIQVRLPPAISGPEAEAGNETAPEPSEGSESSDETPESETGSPRGAESEPTESEAGVPNSDVDVPEPEPTLFILRRDLWPYLAGGGVLLLLAVMLLLRHRRRIEAARPAGEPSADEVPVPDAELGSNWTLEADSDPLLAPTPTPTSTSEPGPSATSEPAPKAVWSPGTAAPAARATLRLACLTGARSGETVSLLLAPTAILGRAPDCTLVIERDAEVSSHHAQLEALSNGRIALRDLGSTNGTRLNGIAVQGIHPVGTGDVIAVGQTEFRVVG